MLVISDSPTFLLEKVAKENNIKISSILMFPHDCEDVLSLDCQTALLLFTESFYNILKIRGSAQDQLEKQSKEILLLISNLINKISKEGIHSYIPLLPRHFLYCDRGSSNYFSKNSDEFFINQINYNLQREYLNNSDVTILNGIQNLSNDVIKDYFRFSTIYNKSNSLKIVEQIKYHKNISYKRFKKLIILDLDNTLWQGTLGDDFIEGIKMDKTDPIGSVFRNVQEILLKLKDSGFLLAISSKNEEEVALRALFENESSLFKKEDIICHKINWDLKSKNIKKICKELNISTKDTIFIDDSTYECEEVQRNCEGISIIQVPKNIYQYPIIIKNSPLFDLDKSSIEDKNRTKLYKDRSEREILLDNTFKEKGTKEDWIISLKQKLIISKLNSQTINIDRIIQLFNRTNQFNLSGTKYNKRTLNDLINNSHNHYYSGNASDRIGSEGLITVIGFKYDGEKIRVENYILSCRVFGRYIEEAMLIPLLNFAVEKNCKIEFIFNDTSRNIIINKFIRKLTDDQYILPIKKIVKLKEKYIKLPIKLIFNN